MCCHTRVAGMRLFMSEDDVRRLAHNTVLGLLDSRQILDGHKSELVFIVWCRWGQKAAQHRRKQCDFALGPCVTMMIVSCSFFPLQANTRISVAVQAANVGCKKHGKGEWSSTRCKLSASAPLICPSPHSLITACSAGKYQNQNGQGDCKGEQTCVCAACLFVLLFFTQWCSDPR